MAENALYEILSHLPAKAAIKLSSCLCKSISDIPTEFNFIKKQCVHSFDQEDGFFLQSKQLEDDHTVFNVLQSQQSSSTFGISDQSLKFLESQRILSSSNGLLLLSPKTRTEFLRVFNPATMTYSQLSAPSGYQFYMGNSIDGPLIECHSPQENVDLFPNDYSIAAVVIKPPMFRRQLAVYSNGRWKEQFCELDVKGGFIRYNTGIAFFSTITRGLVVYYMCTGFHSSTFPPCIAAFDFNKKKLWKTIKLPKEALNNCCASLKLLKWNETSVCLVKVHKLEFTVWVLEENGGEVWRMVMRKKRPEMLGYENGENVKSFGIVGGSKSKSFLMVTKIGVYVYGIEGDNKGKLEFIGEHQFSDCEQGVTVVPYANTLRPVCLYNVGELSFVRLG